MLSPLAFVGGVDNDPYTQNTCASGNYTTEGYPTVFCEGIVAPIGTGRWIYVETVTDTDGNVQEVVFRRNADHWDAATGDVVELMTLKVYPDHDAVKAALLDKSLDAVVGDGVLTPADVMTFRTEHSADFSANINMRRRSL